MSAAMKLLALATAAIGGISAPFVRARVNHRRQERNLDVERETINAAVAKRKRRAARNLELMEQAR